MTYSPWSRSSCRLLNQTLTVLTLVSALLLTACSDDSESDRKSGMAVDVEAMPYATYFEEVGDNMSTRAWEPSDPYVLYSSLLADYGFANQKNLLHKSISAFFASDTQTKQKEGIFYYKEIEDKWRLITDDETDINSGTYYLYGYIPKEDAQKAEIQPYNGSYSNGAVLKINGLNTVTVSDVCVIIGAKKGSDEDHDGGLRAGEFGIDFLGGIGATNHIFLLFDHIYSSLRFSFSVDKAYSALRTIKLTQLELIAFADASGTGVKARYNATITLKANDTGDSPIVGDVVFTEDNTSASVANTPLFNGELTLPEYDSEHPSANFMGRFVPGVNTYFKLRSTYDVYDKQGNLIRKDCQAENTIDLRGKFSITGSTSGHCYTYYIKVQPTYLYMLSEPDVDNPTMVVSN